MAPPSFAHSPPLSPPAPSKEMPQKSVLPSFIERPDALLYGAAECSSSQALTGDRTRVLEPPKEEKISLGYQVLCDQEEVAKSAVFRSPFVVSSSLDLQEVQMFIAKQVMDLVTSEEFRLGLREMYGEDAVNQMLGVGGNQSVIIEMRAKSLLIGKEGKFLELVAENFGAYAGLIQHRLQNSIIALEKLVKVPDPEINGCSVTGSLIPEAKGEEGFAKIDLSLDRIVEIRKEAELISQKETIPVPSDREQLEVLGQEILDLSTQDFQSLTQRMQKQQIGPFLCVLEHFSLHYQKQIDALREEMQKECEDEASIRRRGSVLAKVCAKIAKMRWIGSDVIEQASPIERRRLFLQLESMRKKAHESEQMRLVYIENVYETLLWLSMLDPSREKKPHPFLAKLDIPAKAEQILQDLKEKREGIHLSEQELALEIKIQELHRFLISRYTQEN